jgi:hypothetical protein
MVGSATAQTLPEALAVPRTGFTLEEVAAEALEEMVQMEHIKVDIKDMEEVDHPVISLAVPALGLI